MVVQALDLLYLVVEKHLTGCFRQTAVGKVCFDKLGQMLADKLKHKDWGVRDSALKVVTQVAKMAKTGELVLFCQLEMLLK